MDLISKKWRKVHQRITDGDSSAWFLRSEASSSVRDADLAMAKELRYFYYMHRIGHLAMLYGTLEKGNHH